MKLSQKFDVLQAVLRANIFGTKRPLACHFSITNRCPWKCSYCGFPKLHKKECNTEQALEIVDSLARMGNKRLHLVGGEPSLRNDIDKIAGRAKEHDLIVTMATTGFHFSKIWDKLRDIDIFFLSFDGPQEIHDGQRGKGAYRVLLDAIELLKKNNREFWTTTVLTNQNIDYVDFILDTAGKENFKVNFHLLYYTGTDEYVTGAFHLNHVKHNLIAAQQKYVEVIRYLRRRKRTDMKDIIASSDMYLQALEEWGDLSQAYRKERSRYYKCWAGKLYCYIDANGDVYPCGDIMGRIKPVNCLEKGMQAAFNELPPLPCESCIIACFNELNLMFSLNIKTVLNWLNKV
jgi:MoaA/NifB/PqqE/SkfB family radical SAM enzyme